MLARGVFTTFKSETDVTQIFPTCTEKSVQSSDLECTNIQCTYRISDTLTSRGVRPFNMIPATTSETWHARGVAVAGIMLKGRTPREVRTADMSRIRPREV